VRSIDFGSRWYQNYRRQRRAGAKICESCPFHGWIEGQEKKVKRK
jgi:hypothetical protein